MADVRGEQSCDDMTDHQTSRPESTVDACDRPGHVWRSEVHARVARYRTRRGRRIEGAFSMRFPFPPPEMDESRSAAGSPVRTGASLPPSISPSCETRAELPDAVAAPADSIAPVVDRPQLLAEVANAPAGVPLAAPSNPEPEPRPAAVPRRQGKRKVIAFPRRASSSPPLRPRLADPILSVHPRILDVPEELEAFPSTPLLDGLQLAPQVQPSDSAPADHIELPFQAVEIARRIHAGVLDCAVIGGAAGIFAAASYRLLPRLSFTRPVLLFAAVLPALLWALYQYLFIMYCGATAGMRLAGLRLSTFRGGCPSRQHRRRRVIGLYFSTASLMMGLFWALVDVDGLCWHDRISHTYVIGREHLGLRHHPA